MKWKSITDRIDERCHRKAELYSDLYRLVGSTRVCTHFFWWPTRVDGYVYWLTSRNVVKKRSMICKRECTLMDVIYTEILTDDEIDSLFSDTTYLENNLMEYTFKFYDEIIQVVDE